MKITRFAQSCLLIEANGKRILIDPGYFLFEETLLGQDWVEIDLLLITHKHQDHCYLDAIKRIVAESQPILYSTHEVFAANPELQGVEVKSGDIIEFGDIKIEVTSAIHGYLPKYKKGQGIYDNVGYIIDDGVNRLYATSDTICFENDYQCDVVCLPVSNHGVTMGTFEASLFAKETGARLILPVHLDNPEYPIDYEKLEEHFTACGLCYKVLKIKESIVV